MADHLTQLDRSSYDRLDMLKALDLYLLKIAENHAAAAHIIREGKREFELPPLRPCMKVAVAKHPRAGHAPATTHPEPGEHEK